MQAAPDLNQREQLILHAVVQSYITTAEPVGSRSLVKAYQLELSPATVRNTMADLEELGYLEQLHTSSGRVPTDRGYRYYVDYLMRVQALTLQERTQIQQELAEKLNDADDVLRQTSHLLALTTRHAGLAEAPPDATAEVRHIEVMPIGETRQALLIADNFGRVRTLPLYWEKALAHHEIAHLNQFLNEQLRGVQVDRMRSTVEVRLKDYLDTQQHLAEKAIQLFRLVPSERPGQLFLEGATQLFEQPEFKDIGRAREVFGLLEEPNRIAKLLEQANAGNSDMPGAVVIGGNTRDKALDGISLVAAPYQVAGKKVGMIGVLGPKRMPYSRVTSIVSYTAEMVGKMLTKLGR